MREHKNRSPRRYARRQAIPLPPHYKQEATGLGSIACAKALGDRRDYIGGSAELQKAIAALPDNPDAKQMLLASSATNPRRSRKKSRSISKPSRVFQFVHGKD